MASVLLFLRVLVSDVLLDILFFPVWWYSRGLTMVIKRLAASIRDREHALGLRLWFSSLAKPMYGQRDWQGRIISFVFRVLILVFRTLLFLLWVVLVAAFFILYCLFPLAAVFGVFSYFL